MPVIVKHRPDLSMNDLLSMQSRGVFVPKTPHVGNFYPNNLACLKLGFHMQCVDTTTGNKDAFFHPDCVVRANGYPSRICSPILMSSHAPVSAVPDSACADLFPVGTVASRCHTAALQTVFPHGNIEHYADFTWRHRDILYPLTCEATACAPQLWYRYVYDDGHIAEHSSSPHMTMIQQEGILGISHQQHGWTCPLTITILGDIVVDLTQSDRDWMIHLSGPAMSGYIGQHMKLLSNMYDRYRARVNPALPESVTFHMPTVHDMRLAVIDDRKDALDVLVGAYLAFKNDSSRIRELLRAIENCPDVFYQIEDACFLSQYDLLDETGLKAHDLYIHPYGLSSSFDQLHMMMTELFNIHEHRCQAIA